MAKLKTKSKLFAALLAIFCLSPGGQSTSGHRSIACLDEATAAVILPLQGGLFQEIQDEALRRSALDFYLLLSKVELQAIVERQAIRNAYGIQADNRGLASIYAPPAIVNFSLSSAPAYAPQGQMWGTFELPGAAAVSSEAQSPGVFPASGNAGTLPAANLMGPGRPMAPVNPAAVSISAASSFGLVY